MKAYICDTNIISELMRISPNPLVYTWFYQQENLFLSAITVEEIYFGLTARGATTKRQWFEQFVTTHIGILPITKEIAQRCGVLRGQLRTRGINKAQADLLIAATALEHSMTLVTRNIKDFISTNVSLLNPFEKLE